MDDGVMQALESVGAALSILLMGVCAVRLLARFAGVLRGREAAGGVTHAHAPLRALGAAAAVGLVSRLALYLLGYAMYRMLGVGSDGLLASLEPLWTHWDVRHYLGIAAQGYTAVGDERLRLVFFPLLIWLVIKPFPLDSTLVNVCILMTGMPAGSTTSILADKYGGDAIFESQIIFASTFCSILTIPLLTLLMGV